MSEKRLRNSNAQKSWGVENKQVAANRSTWSDSSRKLDGESPLKVERSFEDTVVNLSSNHSVRKLSDQARKLEGRKTGSESARSVAHAPLSR